VSNPKLNVRVPVRVMNAARLAAMQEGITFGEWVNNLIRANVKLAPERPIEGQTTVDEFLSESTKGRR